MMIFAATGHRPNKLGGYDDEVINRLQILAQNFLGVQPGLLYAEIKVISGMALGWDTAWAMAALALQIPLIAAVPFKGQESKWPYKSREMYEWILSQASEVVIVSEGEYAVEKMQIRNEWMVDHCNKVVALWDGSRGGTSNCIQYARRFKKPIINLWDQYQITQ